MYKHIEQFFKDNTASKLHAFRSGGGLRVLSIGNPDYNNALYGEGPNLQYAFKLLEEDAEHGGRKYKDVYGPIHPHYWTGSYPNEDDKLDGFLYQGYTFDITFQNNLFQIELEYSRRDHTPKSIMKKVSMSGKPVKFEYRNFEFECSLCSFADGSIGHTTRCLTKIDQGVDPWLTELKHIVEASTIEELLTKLVNELNVSEKELVWNELP